MVAKRLALTTLYTLHQLQLGNTNWIEAPSLASWNEKGLWLVCLMGVNSNSNKYCHAHTRGRGEIWPVRFSYNPYFSAYFFFQPEQCFSLATNQPQCFGLFFQRSERGHVRSELITPSHTVQHTRSTQLRTLIRLIHLQPLMSKSLKMHGSTDSTVHSAFFSYTSARGGDDVRDSSDAGVTYRTCVSRRSRKKYMFSRAREPDWWVKHLPTAGESAGIRCYQLRLGPVRECVWLGVGEFGRHQWADLVRFDNKKTLRRRLDFFYFFFTLRQRLDSSVFTIQLVQVNVVDSQVASG